MVEIGGVDSSSAQGCAVMSVYTETIRPISVSVTMAHPNALITLSKCSISLSSLYSTMTPVFFR